MSVSEAFRGVVDESVASMESAPAINGFLPDRLGSELRVGMHTGECELMAITSAGSACTSPLASRPTPTRVRCWYRAPSRTSSSDRAFVSTTTASAR